MKDELRELQKANSIQSIEGMRMLPKEASRFDISALPNGVYATCASNSCS